MSKYYIYTCIHVYVYRYIQHQLRSKLPSDVGAGGTCPSMLWRSTSHVRGSTVVASLRITRGATPYAPRFHVWTLWTLWTSSFHRCLKNHRRIVSIPSDLCKEAFDCWEFTAAMWNLWDSQENQIRRWPGFHGFSQPPIQVPLQKHPSCYAT